VNAQPDITAPESTAPESTAPDSVTPESVAAESTARPAAEPVAKAGGAADLEAEGDIAADYLEELLDIADLDGDLDMDVEGDRAAVSIVGTGLEALVGPEGKVLEALQELTRLAVYRETGERSRLMLDIGGYRRELRQRLVQLTREAGEEVQESGEAVKLSPMTAFERKVVHDAVAELGLRSESDGIEPTRCVVVMPAS
jgi:spoIIIJ-associated protein